MCYIHLYIYNRWVYRCDAYYLISFSSLVSFFFLMLWSTLLIYYILCLNPWSVCIHVKSFQRLARRHTNGRQSFWSGLNIFPHPVQSFTWNHRYSYLHLKPWATLNTSLLQLPPLETMATLSTSLLQLPPLETMAILSTSPYIPKLKQCYVLCQSNLIIRINVLLNWAFANA